MRGPRGTRVGMEGPLAACEVSSFLSTLDAPWEDVKKGRQPSVALHWAWLSMGETESRGHMKEARRPPGVRREQGRDPVLDRRLWGQDRRWDSSTGGRAPALPSRWCQSMDLPAGSDNQQDAAPQPGHLAGSRGLGLDPGCTQSPLSRWNRISFLGGRAGPLSEKPPHCPALPSPTSLCFVPQGTGGGPTLTPILAPSPSPVPAGRCVLDHIPSLLGLSFLQTMWGWAPGHSKVASRGSPLSPL